MEKKWRRESQSKSLAGNERTVMGFLFNNRRRECRQFKLQSPLFSSPYSAGSCKKVLVCSHSLNRRELVGPQTYEEKGRANVKGRGFG